MHTSPLPAPHPDAAVHSQRLTTAIVQTINEAGGAIPFVEFMEQALYAPGLGYYSAGVRKLGADGDFITSPEISPLFSQLLARQCQQVLAALDNGVILEFGAGSGDHGSRDIERIGALRLFTQAIFDFRNQCRLATAATGNFASPSTSTIRAGAVARKFAQSTATRCHLSE
jgi:hypothetical protein